MPLLSDLLDNFWDTLAGHLVLAAFLLAVTDEHAVWRRLKKLPLLLLPAPFIAVLLSAGLYAVPALRMVQYYIVSLAILAMCSLWVQWTWRLGFWQSFGATCMAGIFQVAESVLFMIPFRGTPLGESIPFAAVLGLYLCSGVAAGFGVPYEKVPGGYRLTVADTAAATSFIVAKPKLFTDYEITKGKMDDVFLAVTGKALQGGEEK